MLVQVQHKLGLVNAEVKGWEKQIRESIEHGNNFFLMLPKEAEAVKTFCRLFGLPENCSPKTMTQGEFFLLSQFVTPEAFDSVLHHWDARHQLVFIEQLDFPINRPPRLKDFIVYSPVLGVLGQFERLNRAKEVLAEFLESMPLGAPNPGAAVYWYEKDRWQLFEGR